MNGDLKKELKQIANEIKKISDSVARLSGAAEKTEGVSARAAKKKAAAKKPSAPEKSKLTPTDQVLTIMKRFKKGITVEELRNKSGFNEKQISNIVHRAVKKGKITKVKRGVYKAA